VERLQQQLGELHCTDLNSLRRAYRTLCQHIEALEQESEGLLGDLRGLETDVLTPDVVATEVGGAQKRQQCSGVCYQQGHTMYSLITVEVLVLGPW